MVRRRANAVKVIVALGVLLAACGGSNAAPTPTIEPSPTVAPKVYVMSTSEGMAWLRRVISAYERGDSAVAASQCDEGRFKLAGNDLENVIGASHDKGAKLDYDTLTDICDSASHDGWASIRDAALKAIER